LTWMKKKPKNLKPKVFFNASVILAGLRSPVGGSGKILNWASEGRIEGFTSEIILDEARRHSRKIGFSAAKLTKLVEKSLNIYPAPENLLEKYQKMVLDVGDIHLFTSSEELKVDYLVTLDKKHVLSLSGDVKKFKIVSPGELIEILSKQKS